MSNQIKTLVFIPTYNEKDNAGRICSQILGLNLNLDVLFLDDNSPDGTGRILDRLAAEHPQVHVIHRPSKLGIGSAHMTGIQWAYEHGYAFLVTMDCDFTHMPSQIADFLEHTGEYSIVVGSRYLSSTGLQDWNLFRKALTRLGHFVTRNFLELEYDATGAFRLYRLDRIPQQIFSLVQSRGYSFFFESLYMLNLNGLAIKEIPIELPARTYGHSKMSLREVFRSVNRLLEMRLNVVRHKDRYLLSSIKVARGASSDWNAYWGAKSNGGGKVYDALASIYRALIIRRTLNYFINHHFDRGALLVHAGCGSGQVDEDICHTMNIAALDISTAALNLYRRNVGGPVRMLEGSIFHLPIATESVDGLYNLGVMEHFTSEQIDASLKEFHRVLKQDGKVVLFWPPEFGSTVMLFKLVHFVLNDVLGRNIKLHPDEINRVKSKADVQATLERAGFSLLEYYFGPKDLFTHSIIVAQR